MDTVETESDDGLDARALERLFVRLERPMVNVVYRWLWSRDDAADVVQEAFARLWQHRDRVRADTVEAYVWRIALNLARKRRRWQRLRAFVGLEGLGERGQVAARAEAGLLSAERDAGVRQAVEALPEKHRRVVMMCELSQMSYAEVAAVLEIPEGTVASRRHTALRKLREALGSEVQP